MKVAKEKLSRTKYKVYLIFWIAYWCVTAFLFFSHTGVVLGEAGKRGAFAYVLYFGTVAFMAFAIFFCFHRWGNYYKERTEDGREKKERMHWHHISFLIAADCYSFLMMELINNTADLRTMQFIYVFANLLGGLIMGLIFLFWFNSLRRACLTFIIFATTMSLIFYFVYQARGSVLQLIDIFSFGTAMDVVGGYEFVYTRWVTVFLAASLSIIAMLLHCSDRQLAFKRPGKIIIRIGIFAAMVAGYFGYINTSWNNKLLGITTNLWNPHKNYVENGTNLGFFCVAKFMNNEPPAGYSASKVKSDAEQFWSAYEPKDEEVTTTPVNIIAIMNESWSDYRHVYPELETTAPYMEYYDSLDENIIKGFTMVNITGGGTSKSEYEFLTGNSGKQYPGLVPFVNFFTHDQYSLVSTLEAQGFRSIGIHPNKGTNWNRIKAYDFLGFDEKYFIDDFPEDAAKERGMISDMANYEFITDLVEQKEDPNEPLFIFNVTMQNHGGYKTANYKNLVEVVGYDKSDAGAVNQYLTVIKKSDDALKYLIEYFENVEEPTMIVMFGDHYPGLSDDFEKYLSGNVKEDLPDDEETLYYETPFFIWTNYDMETQNDVTISNNFLGELVMEKTGLQMTPYQYYLQDLQTKIKGYNTIGYYTVDGQFVSWDDADDEMNALLNQYECFQYNALMEKLNRADWFFKIP